MALIARRTLVWLRREVDIYVARELAAMMAGDAGFDRYQCSDIETAVSEVCANALKYGERGWVSIRHSPEGFMAVVTDEGPGFGTETNQPKGLGMGLAGVGRLMDELRIERLEQGSRVTIRKASGRTSVTGGKWNIQATGRLRIGSSRSGDQFGALEFDDGDILVGLVDGLGSGEKAAAAASAALSGAIGQRAEPADPLTETIHRAHVAAADTRGAVGVFVRIRARQGTIEYGGVGDADGYVAGCDQHFSLQAGVLGIDIPRVETRQLPWDRQSRLMAWTDGVALPAFDMFDSPASPSDGDRLERLVLEHGKTRDDGLVVLIDELAVTDHGAR